MPPPPRLPPAHQGTTQAVPGTVRPFWASGHAAAVHHRPSVQPRIPARRHPSRQGRMPCLRLPAFPCRKTPLPPKEDTPVERDGIGLNLSTLERDRTADCSAGCPARPERRPSSAPPKKRKRERHLMGRPRCRLCSQHGAFPASPPRLFNREYRLGDAPAAKGRCARGTEAALA